MNIFSAVGFVIAIEQVLDAVGHSAPPRPKNQLVYHASVLNHDAQQVTERRRAPITRNVGLCKTNVARLQACAEDVPVLKADGGMQGGGLAKYFGAPVGKLNRQSAVLHFFKQMQYFANGHGRRLNFKWGAVRRTGIHDQLILEMIVEGACARVTN